MRGIQFNKVQYTEYSTVQYSTDRMDGWMDSRDKLILYRAMRGSRILDPWTFNR